MTGPVGCLAPLLSAVLPVLLLLLATVVRGDIFQPQSLPSPLPAPLSPTCTPLADGSELVAAYGEQYVGTCAWSFCYQLLSTPFPNQDPTTLTTAMSGYLFTSNVSDSGAAAASAGQLPLSAYGQANNQSYTVVGAVGVRNQSQFQFESDIGSCGVSEPTFNITGIGATGSGQEAFLSDNLLLLGYPHFSLGGVAFNLDQPIAWAGYGDYCMNEPGPQIAQNSFGGEYYPVSPVTSLLYEQLIGTTNYAQISVQPHVEGSGAQFPSCPLYTPPAVSAVPFAYNIVETLPNGLVESSCVSGSMSVSGPYQRYDGYQSWFAVNATGTRSFTDVHNRTTVQNILNVQPPALITYLDYGYASYLSDSGYPLWPDNAVNVDAYGSVSVDYNGILFGLDDIPYSGAVSVAETPYVLFGRSTVDGWVAETAQIDASTGYLQSWSFLYNSPVGTIISSTSDGNFSLTVGNYHWNQTAVYSGLTCPAGVPAVSWTPGTTNYNDPAGLTQVGFVYQWSTGYQQGGAPATSLCIAGVLTLDLLLPGNGQSAYVTNATGVRVSTTSDGQSTVNHLVGVPYFAYYWNPNNQAGIGSSQSAWNFGQSPPVGNFAFRYSDAPTEALVSYDGLYGTSSAFLVIAQQFSMNPFNYQTDLPPSFTVVPLGSASPFVPSTRCPNDTSTLVQVPGATSLTTNTLPQQQLSIAYSIVPNNFSPASEWLVCANLNLTLSATASLAGASTGSPNAPFFRVVNASGTRAFVNLATGAGFVTEVTGVAGPTELPSVWEVSSPADNLLSFTSPFLSFYGLALTTSSAPTYSTGAYGPSAYSIGILQSSNTVYGPDGIPFQYTSNGYSELSSPDGSSSNAVYFTIGGVTPVEQQCDAIVATVQSHAGKDTATTTVPFAYSIQVTADSHYNAWGVCVTGSLTLLSTPFYLSAAYPSAYVIQSVTGSRTFYNTWGQASTASIVGAQATTTTDSNLYYAGAGSNIFPQAGLTLTLSGSAEYNSLALNMANVSTLTISTSNSSGVVSVIESVGDFNSIQAVTYSVTSNPSGSSGTLPACPFTAYPAASATTTVYFSLNWASAALTTNICFQGTFTVATQAVTTVNSSTYSWYPVLAVTGTRVYTDTSVGQSYSQNITGLAAPFSVATNGAVNDNLLGVPVGSVLTSATQAVVSSFGLSAMFGSAPYNPSGVYSNVETLLLGTSADGLQSVVDPNFTPDTAATFVLYSSAASAAQCPTSSNSSLLPPVNTVFYWKLNSTIAGESVECMSGTLQTGTQVLPSGPGQAALPVTAVTGTRYYWSLTSNKAQVAAITGLASVPGVNNALTLTAPYFNGIGLGFGLSFNTSVLQPFNPYDQFDGVDSSALNYTALTYSNGYVSELNQYVNADGIQRTSSSTPARPQRRAAASAQSSPLRSPTTRRTCSCTTTSTPRSTRSAAHSSWRTTSLPTMAAAATL